MHHRRIRFVSSAVDDCHALASAWGPLEVVHTATGASGGFHQNSRPSPFTTNCRHSYFSFMRPPGSLRRGQRHSSIRGRGLPTMPHAGQDRDLVRKEGKVGEIYFCLASHSFLHPRHTVGLTIAHVPLGCWHSMNPAGMSAEFLSGGLEQLFRRLLVEVGNVVIRRLLNDALADIFRRIFRHAEDGADALQSPLQNGA